MSDPKYDKIGDKYDRLIEECAEVIKECTKIKRFGEDSHHPDDPDRVINTVRLRSELEDLVRIIAKEFV